jgi:hypothetical protein
MSDRHSIFFEIRTLPPLGCYLRDGCWRYRQALGLGGHGGAVRQTGSCEARAVQEAGGMTLLAGYFADFSCGPTVLFWGDATAMGELAGLLRASVIASHPFDLDSFVRSSDGRSLVIRIVAKTIEGMVPVANNFEWRIDAETAGEFAELVDVLAGAKSPGHQYLEHFRGCGIVVMASRDEYPITLKPR